MLEDFADTFAPEEEADEEMLGFLQFLGTGLGLVSGPLFGKGKSKKPPTVLCQISA